jgi:hypothetical protein
MAAERGAAGVMAVAMTAWKRPEYLEETLRSWHWARGLEGLAERRVCIDWSEPEMHRQMAETAWRHGWSASVAGHHQGVLVNPVESVSAVFRERPDVDFVILAEEDVVVSSDVLEYFAWAQRFRDDPGTCTVCAHRPQETTVAAPREDAVVRMLGYSSPLVWGTWRDRWEDFICPTWDRDYRANGWDYNLVRLSRLSGRHCVFPEQNRSQHIGKEGGVHSTPAYFEHTISADFRPEVYPQEYRIVEGPAWARSSEGQ